jgi:hypothetical protein
MVGYLDTRRRENVVLVLGGETYNPETGIGKLSSDVWRTRGLGMYMVGVGPPPQPWSF